MEQIDNTTKVEADEKDAALKALGLKRTTAYVPDPNAPGATEKKQREAELNRARVAKHREKQASELDAARAERDAAAAEIQKLRADLAAAVAAQPALVEVEAAPKVPSEAERVGLRVLALSGWRSALVRLIARL